MEKFITVVGTRYYFGPEVFKVNQIITLEKDKDNDKDEEAIKVLLDSGVIAGYVANSVNTVAKGCRSAGRIYDSFEEKIKARVLFIVDDVVIARLEETIDK